MGGGGLLPAMGVLAQSFPAERIIAGASGDWNKDEAADLALLVAPENDDGNIGIYLYVTESDRGLLKPGGISTGQGLGQ